MKYIELNIKEGMPLVDEAMRYMQASLERFKKEKYNVVLIVHGYGSTGKGGAICAKARQWLKAQVKNGKFKKVIFGEDFNVFNFDALDLKAKCHSLEQLFKVCNNGVTVVEL